MLRRALVHWYNFTEVLFEAHCIVKLVGCCVDILLQGILFVQVPSFLSLVLLLFYWRYSSLPISNNTAMTACSSSSQLRAWPFSRLSNPVSHCTSLESTNDSGFLHSSLQCNAMGRVDRYIWRSTAGSRHVSLRSDSYDKCPNSENDWQCPFAYISIGRRLGIIRSSIFLLSSLRDLEGSVGRRPCSFNRCCVSWLYRSCGMSTFIKYSSRHILEVLKGLLFAFWRWGNDPRL